MAGTEVDFKVKAGIVVEGDATLKGGDGAITFPAASSIKILDNSATALVIEEANTAYQTFHTTNSGEKIQFHKALDIDAASDFGSNAMTNVNIDSGAIDGTNIGANSHGSGKFTTLQTTGTYRADATVVTGSTVSINNANTASPSLNSNSDTQINGTFKGSGTNGSSLMTSELRLKSDISNDDLGGSWNDYQGDANLLVMENAENQPAGGQGVVFSVGASGTGSAWATGRMRSGTSSDDIFTIGYRGTNWDAVGYKNGTSETTASPLQLAQSKFTINTDGNVGIHTLGGKLIFRGHASGDTSTVYEHSFNASTASTAAVSYVLPTGAPGGNGYVLSSTTGGQLSWVASASGADGMGSGFVLEDDDGTEVTIDENKEVKFIGAGITTNWTDTSTGSDATPYDLTFTLDVDGVSAAAIASGDLVPFADTSDAGNATRKESIDDIATLFAGAGLTATNAVIAVDADQSGQITAVGTLTGLTVSGAADLNNNLTVDGATISLDATTSLNIDNSNTTNGISIGTATSGVPITIGHGTSEVTFGDNVTITGNLTVNGEQTVINSTAIVAEDKSMVLGIAGGMEDATYARSSSTVTVTSSSHGFSNGEYVYVSNMGNSIADGVYTVSSVATNTFVLDGHGTSGTVGAGATMQHSSANVTEGTADGSGIFAPGTSLHSIQYDSSNGWTVSDDLEIASGKHISIAGNTTLDATSLGLFGNSTMNANVLTYNTLGGTVVNSSLTGVGVLASGSIASGFGTISTGNAITTTAAITGGSLVADNITIDGNTISSTNSNGNIVLTPNGSGLVNIAKDDLAIAGVAVTTTAAELNLLDTAAADTVVNSKAVIYSSNGQVKASTVSVDAIAVIDTSTATGQSWTGGTANTVASYAFGTFRTAKFVCQISNGTDFDVAEVLVTYKGESAPANDAAVYLTTYAYIGTAASDLGSFDAVKGTTTIDLKFTPVSNGTYSYDIVNTVLVK